MSRLGLKDGTEVEVALEEPALIARTIEARRAGDPYIVLPGFPEPVSVRTADIERVVIPRRSA